MPGTIYIVVGGQWGSEGKGMVCNAMAKRHKFPVAVRTGAINAGHTIWHDGRRWAMQQLPSAWTEASTYLVLGPGAYIHPPTLERELNEIHYHTGWKLEKRLLIDERCAIHPDFAEAEATLAGRHYSIGATGKGCAEAVIHKIAARGKGAPVLFRDTPAGRGYQFGDTVDFVGDVYDKGGDILLEGTQGTLLDLHLGDYPFTTSRMTTAANWMAEAGLSPSMNTKIIMVLRTYPIRVAGNSGPMPGEISWSMLAHQINAQLELHHRAPLVRDVALHMWDQAVVAVGKEMGLPESCPPTETYMWSDENREKRAMELSELHVKAWGRLKQPDREELSKLFEMTTVTKKMRRIATLDPKTTERAIRIERPHFVVISFLNYEFPEMWGRATWNNAPKDAKIYLSRFEKRYKVQVPWVTTGPGPQHLVPVS